jgi:CRISPR-associated protein Cas6
MRSFCEVSLEVRGSKLPFDHSYPLFGGLGRLLPPEFHSAEGSWENLGIHPINGDYAKGDTHIRLARNSRLNLLVDTEIAEEVMRKLAFKMVEIGGTGVILGTPQVYLLRPAPVLYSRIVTIAKMATPETFRTAAAEMLSRQGISGEVSLTKKDEHTVFRTREVKGIKIIGYPVTVSGLSIRDSLLLQSYGLGGRRHFGCGLFIPVR